MPQSLVKIMTKRTSTSMISDLLMNEQQRSRFVVRKEYVDYKRLIHRNRVENQTIYDVMLVASLIEQAQHEAIILFMNELAESGANPSSVNLDAINHVPAYLVGSRMSEQRMAFSAAYRAMVKGCGDRGAGFLMVTTRNVYVFPRKKGEQRDFAKRMAGLIDSPLWALASHYNISDKVDPRHILRRQLGIESKKRKQKKPRQG